MGLRNWIKGKLCTNKTGHEPRQRYDGLSVIGYECRYCGYRWYEKRKLE